MALKGSFRIRVIPALPKFLFGLEGKGGGLRIGLGVMEYSSKFRPPGNFSFPQERISQNQLNPG